MAQAIVLSMRAGGKESPGNVAYVITVTYTGADVPDDIEGQAYDVPVVVASGYTFANLRGEMANAVNAHGSMLGLSVAEMAYAVFGLHDIGIGSGTLQAIATTNLTASVAVDAPLYKASSIQVLSTRRTGWTDQTATASRADLGAAPTNAQLASFCRALYDDLKAHGAIGN